MPNSSLPIQSEPEIPENLQGRWNYLQSEHLQDKVYPENPATINFERAYIRRIAKAESQLARYRAPVSDEEWEKATDNCPCERADGGNLEIYDYYHGAADALIEARKGQK